MIRHYDMIRISEEIYREREKSVRIEMMYDIVLAPKRVCPAEHHEDGTVTMYIPSWVFTRKGQNACQVYNAKFLGHLAV